MGDIARRRTFQGRPALSNLEPTVSGTGCQVRTAIASRPGLSESTISGVELGTVLPLQSLSDAVAFSRSK
jgi:hypothetical protein